MNGPKPIGKKWKILAVKGLENKSFNRNANPKIIRAKENSDLVFL